MFLDRFLYLLSLSILYMPNEITSFYSKSEPISSINLIENKNQTDVMMFPSFSDSEEHFNLIMCDKDMNYLVLGARDKLIHVVQKDKQVQILETKLPETRHMKKDCDVHECFNYILLILPLSKENNDFNTLICGTYFGLFQCIEAFQNQTNGLIENFSNKSILSAPKSVTNPLTGKNTYYMSEIETISDNKKSSIEYVMYTASSWTENSQYLAAHSSRNNYQEYNLFKKIGASKSFVRFLENDNKLFLFHNELSFEIDEGETDRDILVSTSLVTQFCKNDLNILNNINPVFYTELTAKIYCFNEAFKSNSGNSKIFKFDSLEYISNLINLNSEKESSSKQLFYGIFNTPKNQITGTAICFFDLNDFSMVFQNQNFKRPNYSFMGNAEYKFMPQNCPNLTITQKYNYEKFTSKIGSMNKAIFPINKRKASFIATEDFRLTTLLVLDERKNQVSPKLRKLEYDYLNIILAGSDNGKLFRLAHFYNSNYFLNQKLDEEKLIFLEEIQLFSNKSINEIRVLRNRNNGSLIAISNDQIKVIPEDLCSIYSTCEQCTNRKNMIDVFEEICIWKNKCVSISKKDPQIINYPLKTENCLGSNFLKTKLTTKEFIIKVINISNSESQKTGLKPNRTLEENEKLNSLEDKYFQNESILILYGALGTFLILTITLTVILVSLTSKKSKTKLILERFKENISCIAKDNSIKPNSSMYMDSIYSFITNINKRNQNIYQINSTNKELMTNSLKTPFDCMISENIISQKDTSFEVDQFYQLENVENGIIIDYSLMPGLDSETSVETIYDVKRGKQETNFKFPLNSLNKGNSNSPFCQERPSIIIANDENDGFFDKNLIFTIDKGKFSNLSSRNFQEKMNTLF
ncbi:unnamed protein product [Brachionus calyciflorus]|uniref:Sema domain-containing protein n=1 Tax=Brachionus calyciflorus TaxID=104777 RepID=A0A813YDC2_9BILA|nr:unnamed protein product [Brachionus calyciflorus]